MSNSGTKHTRLLSFSVIEAAVNGDPDAINIVLRHFSGYIATLSKRYAYDQNGNFVTYYDEDIRRRLETKLILAILNFELN